jgi:tRNA pseudouridine38-40 synthase
MFRYFFEISYNGSDFFGWQKQPNQLAVQEVIEKALAQLYSCTSIAIVGCGRTDAGVHAYQYYFHADLINDQQERHLEFKLNRMLPLSIAVKKVFRVEDHSHARFSARLRTYRYFIHQKKDPFKEGLSLYYPQVLNFDQMNMAATRLIGKQDFTSFSKLHTDVKTNICAVTQAKWNQQDDDSWYFEISADRFLRNMVRSVVGTLLDIGSGKMRVEDIESVVVARDRGAASLSVPAHGLFLWEVNYGII